ncbi:MAG: hypothetical protein QM747_10795 [Nocardioides sp.]
MRVLGSRRWGAVAAVPVAALFVGSLTPGAEASSPAARTTTVFVVHDRAITEDSGLAQAGRFFVTTNDNGSSATVYTLNQRGRTVGTTNWARRQHDCEAIAPINAGHVWIGDIGDNDAVRSSILVSKVPVGRGDRTVRPKKYHLVYPDGPHNAETLLRDPTTGALYIVTKSPTGGTLYAVPKPLSAAHANQLVPIAPVPLAKATDGAFFASGNYLVIRDYDRALLYAWPSMTQMGTFRLPTQPQGEGLATDTGGSVFLSTEGVRQPVLHYRLPAKLRRILKTPPE